MRGMTSPQRMTPLTIVNSDGGAHVVFAQKEVLKAAGWVITSGDGLSAYDGTTDVITHNSTGAGGMRNNRSWFRARQPTAVNGIRKEFCLQVVVAGATASVTTVRAKFSPVNGFVGGSPSATQVPSATDEQVMMGNVGTDASPTGAAGWIPTNGSIGIGIADAASPHGFAFWFIDTSGVDNDFINGCRWVLDPLRAPHHTLVQDPDQYVVHCTIGGSGNDPWFVSGISSTSVSASYGSPGVARLHNGTWATVSLQVYHSSSTGPNVQDDGTPPVLLDQWNSTIMLVPAIYLSAVSGIKGISTMMHWMAGPITTSANNQCFTVDGEANAYIKRQILVLPWGGSPPGDFTTSTAAFLDVASGNVLGNPPVISAIVPAVGVVPGTRSAGMATRLTFTISDPDSNLGKVVITAKYANRGETYVVYDGTNFPAPFTGSTKVVGLSTIDFSLMHTGGWLEDVTLQVQAWDLAGNAFSTTLAYTFAGYATLALAGGLAVGEVDHLFGKDIWFDAFSNRSGDYKITPAGDWLLATGVEALRQAILRRVMTNPGEWATLPDYGVGARMFVKARNTPAARAELTERIRAQVLRDDRVESVEQIVVELLEGGLRISVQVQPKGRPLRSQPVTATIEVT